MTYWQRAYEEHGPVVFAFLSSRLPRRQDAEDLLQETFVRAIRASGRLRDENKMRPYLMSIAHNLMVNDARRRRPRLFSEAATTTESTPFDDFPADTESPEAMAHLTDLEQRLENVLDDMTPDQQTAFRLAVLRQERYRDIAKQTGWSEAKVKINVYRARKRAIAALREFLPEETDA